VSPPVLDATGGLTPRRSPVLVARDGKEFGACWASLELPRHLVFFNRAALARLCARASLCLLRYETPFLEGLWCYFTSAWRQAEESRGRGQRAWNFLRLGLRINLILPALSLRCACGSGLQAIAIAVKDPRAERTECRS
jgi:hypothetical protein